MDQFSSTILKIKDIYWVMEYISLQKYMGKSVVRGISVNHWQACLHWARKDANFTVDYYFSGMYVVLQVTDDERMAKLQLACA